MSVVIVTLFVERPKVLASCDFGIAELLDQPITSHSIYGHLVTVIENIRQFVRTEIYVSSDRPRKKGPYSGEERRKQGKAAGELAEENGQQTQRTFGGGRRKLSRTASVPPKP
ncbi:MAG: hypothetical protein CFH05_01722 [Alphaproteobacteria bacterium MarineAlpha3_Bin4]|nr:MAG: hypothetical protein CFH05_01722 [Alphaproteobacteria bacterium MarineAlpha3_Bin4]